MSNEEKERRIEEVLDNFDFQKVLKVMRLLNWKWATKNGDLKVPSLYQIMSTANMLLNDVVHYIGTNGHKEASCGGLKASVNAKGDLSLSFEITCYTFYNELWTDC